MDYQAIADRPHLPPTNGREERRAQREILRATYPDFDPTRLVTFRDRYNDEAEKARFELYCSRRIKGYAMQPVTS